MAASAAKIFGIGLSKTGTTSLANALETLGYKTRDNLGVVEYAAGNLSSSIDLDAVEACDALTDTPIPSFYRELDARFPGSKFILTVRDADGWLKSCQKQFTQRFAASQTDAHKRLFLDLYGTDVFEETRFASGYRRFVDGVRDYFKDRPGDLLTIDVAAGEGWEKLCPFLGRPAPDVPFPKANVTRIAWTRLDDLVGVAKQGGLELMRRYDRANGANSSERTRAKASAGRPHRLVDRLMKRLLNRDGVEAAVQACHRVVVKRLEDLNSQIPVVSRAVAPASYEERHKWNHLWLLDPLDGEGSYARGESDFTVNIALVEDGKPIYGVVYAPATGIAYYGRAGKGGFRRIGEEPAAKLTVGSSQPVAQKVPDVSRGNDPASVGLSMCAAIDGNPGRRTVFGEAMEWQTAAAHAVARAAGAIVCECDSGRELAYNKPDLSHPSFRIG
jgi:3'-phosphoadenosine 5'-phosphosulfate (PAPS) 3'-phosphatase